MKKSFSLIISGILFGISFPPDSIGAIAFFSFTLFLFVIKKEKNYFSAVRSFYIFFLIANLIALYWISGFTHLKDGYLVLAGILTIVVHPFFFLPAILLFTFFRNQLGETIAMSLFPFLWTSYEWFRSYTEFAFPWLTVGNTQTYDLQFIQISSVFGVYGISFLVLLINVLFVFLYEFKDESKIKSISIALGILLLYFIPKIYGNYILENQKISETEKISVAIIQPNIDPFDKWTNSVEKQITVLKEMSNITNIFNPDLIVFPETAIPKYLNLEENYLGNEKIYSELNSIGKPILTGVPFFKYVSENTFGAKQISNTNSFYQAFNSSMLFFPNKKKFYTYSKMQLVPFAEHVPYSQNFSFLKNFGWGFGISDWNVGDKYTVFKIQNTKFANIICFESVFPHHFTKFDGAEFFTIITNDSWWGNTSGAIQHYRFAILRAIENRKWIVRSANGGISCFIDPFGNVHKPTQYDTKKIIFQNIFPNSEKTFYANHIDWFPIFSTIFLSFAFVFSIIKKINVK